MKEKKSGVKEREKSPQRDRERTGRGAEEREGLESGEERHGGADRLCSEQKEQLRIDKRDRRCLCLGVCLVEVGLSQVPEGNLGDTLRSFRLIPTS